MNNRSGITTIAVVVAISLTLTAIIVTIQAITLLNVRMARNSISEKSTFYAAEGIIYDTLARMNASYDSNTENYGWPSTYGTPETLPSVNGIDIVRTIRDNPSEYQIDVTAGNKNSNRRLLATIAKTSGGFTNTDIVLVIDRSGSMSSGGTRVCDANLCTSETEGWVNPPYNKNLDCSIFSDCELISQPIYTAGSAAQYFVDLVRDDTNNALIRTAYVGFGSKAKVIKQLDNNHSRTYQSLKRISIIGWTNIYQALDKAQGEFDVNTHKRVIILLTDGLPNMYNLVSHPDCPIPSNPTTDINYQTSDCVKEASDLANALKSNGILIYTIGFGLAEPHDDLNSDQIAFAHSFLDSISSSPSVQYSYYLPSWTDWTSDSTLHDVYANILQNILGTPFLDIKELAPE